MPAVACNIRGYSFNFRFVGENEAEFVGYCVDARRSRFMVQVFAEGLLSVFGHDPVIAVRGFVGHLKFMRGTLDEASLRMSVKADSLAVASSMSRKDRQEIERIMFAEVLEVAKYPEIVYVSTKVTPRRVDEREYQVRIEGRLALHGVTRDAPINAHVSFDADGQLRARGRFSLRQRDYLIKPAAVAAGALRVRDELKLSFDISATERAD